MYRNVSNWMSVAGLAVLLAVAAQASAGIISPVAYYRLGEDDPGALAGDTGNATTEDNLGSHDLVNRQGTPTYTADAAPFNSLLAMDFDPAEGDESYYKTAPVTTATDNFILEAWANTDSTDGEAYVAYNGDAGANGYGLELRDGEWWGLFGGGGGYGGHLDFNVAATVDQWTHLALVREAGTTSLYVGGTAATKTFSSALGTPASYFTIGALMPYSGHTFDGQIDKVRLSTFTGDFDPGWLLVPEPSTIVLLLSGVVGLLLAARARRQKRGS